MNSKAFKRQAFAWLEQMKRRIKERAYPATAFLIAHELVCAKKGYFNEEHGGAAWPSCKTLADAIGKSEATVISMVHRMEAGGDLRVEWGSRGSGHSNRYFMILKKPQSAEVFGLEKTSETEAQNLSFSKIKPQPAEVNPLK